MPHITKITNAPIHGISDYSEYPDLVIPANATIVESTRNLQEHLVSYFNNFYWISKVDFDTKSV